MVKVSIIIPVYNVEKYISKCLDTLVNQTLEEIELIVVNDGSTDESENIIMKYKEKYPDKILYLKKSNGGLSDARNYGVNYAKGEFIAFLDSDDYVELDTYEKLYSKSKECNKEIKIVECNFFWSYEKEEVIDYIEMYDSLKDYLVNGRVVAWNKLYNRAWIESLNIKFPKGLLYEDLEYFMKLVANLRNIEEIAVVKEPLIHYVQRKGAISYSETQRIAHIVEIYENVFSYYKEKDKYNYYRNELEYKFCRNLLGNFMKKALRVKNRKIKRELLNLFWNSINSNFPEWRKNKYILKNIKYQNLFMRFIPGIIYKSLYIF